jgi:hypothetical protein
LSILNIVYRSVLIGAFFSLLFLYCASNATSSTSFFWLYAIGCGIGNAFLYPTSLISACSYFTPLDPRAITSVVVGLCFGGAVFGVLSHYIVNPSNLPMIEVAVGSITEFYFPPEVNANVPSLLKLIILLWASIFFISFFTISY